MSAHEELVDEGRHLYDLALADGVDAGRYVTVPATDTMPAIVRRGPRFDDRDADGYMQRLIGRSLEVIR